MGFPLNIDLCTELLHQTTAVPFIFIQTANLCMGCMREIGHEDDLPLLLREESEHIGHRASFEGGGFDAGRRGPA